MMLRVLTLSTLFPDATRPNFGVFVEAQTRALAALPDVAVTVVAPIGVAPWPLSLLPSQRARGRVPVEEVRHGLHVHRPRFLAVPGTGGRHHPWALEQALVPVLDRMASRFDVIDASFFFPDGPAAVALGRRYGVPVSIKARGADIHYWGTRPGTADAVRDAGCGADGLLAVSAAMREDMAVLGIPRDSVRVHHTGVDLALFVPVDRAAAKRALEVEGPLVASVGALIARKGHDIVIAALAALPGATLAILGEGPDRRSLARAARRAGVADRVRFLGAVPHDALPSVLAAADVMALASASEGLANAWIEALACGVPIVIPDAGGAREVMTHRAAGRIADRTPAAFAAAIADLLARPPSVVETRGVACGFTWEANALALREHLAGLVASRHIGKVEADGAATPVTQPGSFAA